MLESLIPFLGGFLGGNFLFKDKCASLRDELDAITAEMSAIRNKLLIDRRTNPGIPTPARYNELAGIRINKSRELLICTGEGEDLLRELNAVNTGR